MTVPPGFQDVAFLQNMVNFGNPFMSIRRSSSSYGGFADNRGSRRLPAAVRAQALRAGGERRRALHQGNGQMALSQSRARPLAGGGAGDAGARARAGAADRRRQPRSAAGMGAA